MQPQWQAGRRCPGKPRPRWLHGRQHMERGRVGYSQDSRARAEGQEQRTAQVAETLLHQAYHCAATAPGSVLHPSRLESRAHPPQPPRVPSSCWPRSACPASRPAPQDSEVRRIVQGSKIHSGTAAVGSIWRVASRRAGQSWPQAAAAPPEAQPASWCFARRCSTSVLHSAVLERLLQPALRRTCTSSLATEAADAFTLWLAGLAVAERRRTAAWLLDMDLRSHRGRG